MSGICRLHLWQMHDAVAADQGFGDRFQGAWRETHRISGDQAQTGAGLGSGVFMIAVIRDSFNHGSGLIVQQGDNGP